MTEVETLRERASYGIGVDVGGSLLRGGADIDVASFIQGFRDTLAGRPLLINREERHAAMTEYSDQMRAEQMAAMEELGRKNLVEGNDFLEANKAAEGVVTTRTGLQYTVLEEGDGPKPAADARVKVHYTGTLIDGTKFDSSYDRGEPAEFRLAGVIKGWGEALQLMSVGSRYKLFIPAELAYGDRGMPPMIGPNAVLIFEVELLEIVE